MSHCVITNGGCKKTSFDSIMAIKEFENVNNLVDKEGRTFLAKVTAFVNNDAVYCGNVDCMLSYDYGYSQYEITIDWMLSEKELKQRGLHMGYNTNFQDCYYADSELTIMDEKTKLVIVFVSIA